MGKQMAILIYTTPEKLLHKQGKLPDDDDYSETGEYYWQLPQLPKHSVDRVYFATKGFVRGYFEIEDENASCNEIIFNCRTWHDVKPLPQKPFQGFKYLEVEDGS
jgi:hypothetical protein